MTFEDCQFEGNHAGYYDLTGHGGAISVSNSQLKLLGPVRIAGNDGVRLGGGIYAVVEDPGYPEVVFVMETVRKPYIELKGGSAPEEAIAISGNTAMDGGGVCIVHDFEISLYDIDFPISVERTEFAANVASSPGLSGSIAGLKTSGLLAVSKPDADWIGADQLTLDVNSTTFIGHEGAACAFVAYNDSDQLVARVNCSSFVGAATGVPVGILSSHADTDIEGCVFGSNAYDVIVQGGAHLTGDSAVELGYDQKVNITHTVFGASGGAIQPVGLLVSRPEGDNVPWTTSYGLDITVGSCNFVGRERDNPPYPPAAIWVDSPLPTNSVLAQGNWWGDPDGPNPPPDYENDAGGLISYQVDWANPELATINPGTGECGQ